MNLKTEICNAFNKSAATYEQAAQVQYEIGERLFARLDYLTLKPRYVLDLGCGTGVFTGLLQKKYPKAHIVSLDVAYAMLQQIRKKQKWFKQRRLVNADMVQLPFADGLFDLIFANQVIHWSNSIAAVFNELNRVMQPQGCLMFSTLGPDTFKELKVAWSQVDAYAHVNQFTDMHDIGDFLVNERFLDPVIDMEILTVRYANLKQLLQNLKAQGIHNINLARNPGLTSKEAWLHFEQAYQTLFCSQGKYPLSYEVIYGHAWKGAQYRRGAAFETLIPITKIRRMPVEQ